MLIMFREWWLWPGNIGPDPLQFQGLSGLTRFIPDPARPDIGLSGGSDFARVRASHPRGPGRSQRAGLCPNATPLTLNTPRRDRRQPTAAHFNNLYTDRRR